MKSHLFFVGKMFLGLSILVGLISKNSLLMKWSMVDLGSCKLDLLVLMDWVSLLFFFTLCIVVSCVLKFSSVYMENEKFPLRFHYLVYSFMFSMFCLMFFPHFFFMLVGWDGLGMTSFLLVMYYSSSSSWAAGMKTYLINRIGDGFFLMALALLLNQGHWDVKGISDKGMYPLFMIVLVLGCFTKSAQFPFSSWLPAAMAAPTPVSSLVHSSTLVTAGVYMLMRFSYIMPNWMFLMVGLLGLWTLYSASMAACFEWDAKKMVAYSTLSQLGFMVVAISSGLESFAFFHLITHAMFKAVMFMSVGYLMIKKNHFQDLRSLSGMWKCSPLMSASLVMSGLSLLGFPFMSGFFSKELMIESNLFMMNEMFYHLLMFSLPLTSYYMCRLVFQLFSGKGYKVFSRQKDSKVILMSILPLFLGSVLMGKMMSDNFFSNSFMYPCSSFKLMVNILILSGVLLAWFKVQSGKSTFSWFYSEILFISPFKGKYWVDKMVDIGEEMNYLFDQGNMSSVMYNLDTNLLKCGSLLSNLYSYFNRPNVGLYVLAMMVMILLNWCLV